MSYIVSLFAALKGSTTDSMVRKSNARKTSAEMMALYYSPISPRLT